MSPRTVEEVERIGDDTGGPFLLVVVLVVIVFAAMLFGSSWCAYSRGHRDGWDEGYRERGRENF